MAKNKSYNSIGKEEVRAAHKLMKAAMKNEALLSGFLGRGNDKFFGGPIVRMLEDDFKKFFGSKHAVSFNSATTALQAAVAALGIGPGDQVITSPFTMSATPASVLFNGAVPVFADIDPKTYCMSAQTIERKITPQTKAIIVVNLFGGSADFDAIKKLAARHSLKIIEDNAQAPGAMYQGRYTGTIGDIGVFSFNVHKAIQAGEGGMLVTNNNRYAYRAQLVRNHGEMAADDFWKKGRAYQELVVGNNYRLTEFQAAIMIEQLKKLNRFNAQRIELAHHLTENLKKFDWISPAHVLPGNKHVYYLYPLRFNAERAGISRNTFVAFMKKRGFDLQEGYQKPIYLLPIYQKKRIYAHSQFPFISKEYPQRVSYTKGICPVAESMFEKELVVTNICQPPRTKRDIDSFIKALFAIESHD